MLEVALSLLSPLDVAVMSFLLLHKSGRGDGERIALGSEGLV